MILSDGLKVRLVDSVARSLAFFGSGKIINYLTRSNLALAKWQRISHSVDVQMVELAEVL